MNMTYFRITFGHSKSTALHWVFSAESSRVCNWVTSTPEEHWGNDPLRSDNGWQPTHNNWLYIHGFTFPTCVFILKIRLISVSNSVSHFGTYPLCPLVFCLWTSSANISRGFEEHHFFCDAQDYSRWNHPKMGGLWHWFTTLNSVLVMLLALRIGLWSGGRHEIVASWCILYILGLYIIGFMIGFIKLNAFLWYHWVHDCVYDGV